MSFDVGNSNNITYDIQNLIILFAAKRSHKKRLLTGEGKIPNLLGRDILEYLSLGYSKVKDYLFITGRNKEYYEALKKEFPPR